MATGYRLGHGQTPQPINYFNNFNIELSKSPFADYADAAGVTPVDGVGGSPTFVSSQTLINPLRGSASLLLVKDAANRQGQGTSIDLVIDSVDAGKFLLFSMDYSVISGTYASGDLAFYIYDITNNTIITPTVGLAINTAATGVGTRASFGFMSVSTSTSYRLCFHVSTTSASAYSLTMDSFSLGPSLGTVYAKYTQTAAQTVGTSNVIINYANKVHDTHNAVTVGAAWKFTCPVGEGGLYQINANVLGQPTAYTAGAAFFGELDAVQNSSNFSTLGNCSNSSTATMTLGMSGGTQFRLAPGDTIDIRCTFPNSTSTVLNVNAQYNTVTICKIRE